MNMDFSRHFKGKKITVMGLGLLGRALGDARFLAEQGAELIVTDLKTKEALAESVAALEGFSNISFTLGEHRYDDFADRDYILKSADVPHDSPYIEAARKNNIPIKMSSSWFAELTAGSIPIIGVTGTRGKSTTTHLLYEIMKRARLNVLLGGNVRGVSTLAFLSQVSKDSIALFELDSWQLQGWGEAKISPNISVFTTFLPDHMNYYKGDVKAYLEDKAQIFLHQEASDTLVLGEQVAPVLKDTYKRITSKVVIADMKRFPKSIVMSVPGEHNRQNALCAILAARAFGVDEDVIHTAVSEFRGVSGRLEFLKEVDGISIYNDSTSTTPDSLRAALLALDTGSKNIILIMGGSDKGVPIERFPVEEMQKTKSIFLLAGSGTDTIRHLIPDAPVFDALAPALDAAFDAAESGDTILFSPGFASFGMFKNEFDRNDQFVAGVQKRS